MKIFIIILFLFTLTIQQQITEQISVTPFTGNSHESQSEFYVQHDSQVSQNQNGNFNIQSLHAKDQQLQYRINQAKNEYLRLSKLIPQLESERHALNTQMYQVQNNILQNPFHKQIPHFKKALIMGQLENKKNEFEPVNYKNKYDVKATPRENITPAPIQPSKQIPPADYQIKNWIEKAENDHVPQGGIAKRFRFQKKSSQKIQKIEPYDFYPQQQQSVPEGFTIGGVPLGPQFPVVNNVPVHPIAPIYSVDPGIVKSQIDPISYTRSPQIMDHIDVTPVEKFTSGQILDKIAEIQKLSVQIPSKEFLENQSISENMKSPKIVQNLDK